jgi:hypothetical protein
MALTCRAAPDRDAATTLPRLVQSISTCIGDVHPVIGECGLCSGYRGCRNGKGKLPDAASESHTCTCSQLSAHAVGVPINVNEGMTCHVSAREMTVDAAVAG